jgi:hypothetical protein
MAVIRATVVDLPRVPVTPIDMATVFNSDGDASEDGFAQGLVHRRSARDHRNTRV